MSRRDQIAMTMDEIRAYLKAQQRLILVSNGANGYPHPMPMNFVFDDDDHYLLTTFRKSQKVRNLERDPRCSLLVESGQDYSELKSVLAYATAEIIDDPDYTAAVIQKIGEKEAAIAGMALPDNLREAGVASAPKRVVLRYRADSYISWDHGKLGGKY